jgi:hypothetical protein
MTNKEKQTTMDSQIPKPGNIQKIPNQNLQKKKLKKAPSILLRAVLDRRGFLILLLHDHSVYTDT